MKMPISCGKRHIKSILGSSFFDGTEKIERHFLAEKEEYPIRIVFVGNAEIYDILYISEAEIQLVNQLFSRQKLDGCGHVVIVENPEEIPQIEIPNVIGFCTVQEEEGGVEYYRRE